MEACGYPKLHIASYKELCKVHSALKLREGSKQSTFWDVGICVHGSHRVDQTVLRVFSNLCDVQQAVYLDFTVEVLARPSGRCRKHIERRAVWLRGQVPVQRPQKRSATLLTALGSFPSGDWSPRPTRCQLSSRGRTLPGTGLALPDGRGLCPQCPCVGSPARGGGCPWHVCLGGLRFPKFQG